MTKEIQLNRSSLKFLVDDEDYELAIKYKWRLIKEYIGRYTTRTGKLNRTIIWLHREIMQPPDDMQIDHINHNILDNRKSNLRICTHKQNVRNQKRKSGLFKGVFYDKRYNMYRVSIHCDGIGHYLGSFENAEMAAEEYDRAAIYFFKEFAYLNFPDRIEEYKKDPYNPDQAIPRAGKYLGVCWHSRRLKYMAYINVNGKRQNLGYFEFPEEAARVRDEEAAKYGKKLNFPPEREHRNDMKGIITLYLKEASPSSRIKFIQDISKSFCAMCGNDYIGGICEICSE